MSRNSEYQPFQTLDTITTKALKTTSVFQFQGREFTEAECVKKAEDAFKKDYKGVELKRVLGASTFGDSDKPL